MLKKLYSHLSLLSIGSLLLFLQSANAQWQQTNGPFGCQVNCLAQHDSVILSGTMQGLYFSGDSGITWQAYSLFQNKNIESIYSKGDTLIMLYSSGYLDHLYFDSTFSITSFDNGANWTSPVFFSPNGGVNFTLHEAPGKIIALDIYVGPYVTLNYGLTWNAINLPGGLFVDLKFNGNYMFLNTIDSSFTTNFYFISRLDTISFTPVDTPNYSIKKVAVDSVIFGNRVNVPGYYDIVKSTDFGQSWNTIAVTDSFQNFSLGATDSIFWFRTSSYYYIYTTDYGTTWDTLPPNPSPVFLAYIYPIDIGNHNLLLTNGIGFSIYNTINDSIILLTNDIKGAYLESISSNDSVIYCNGNNLFRSTDDGNSWDSLASMYFYSAPQLIYGDTLFASNFDVYRSYDGGHSWTTIVMPEMVFYMAQKGNRIYASSGWHTYYTDDFGDHFYQVVDPPYQSPCGFNGNGGSLCVFANHLFFADLDGAVYRLDQNDSNWTYCFCIPFIQFQTYNEPLMFTINNTVIISSDLGIFYSTDTGNTWMNTSCMGVPFYVTGDKVYPNSLVGVGNSWIGAFEKGGVLITYNYGDTWSPLGGVPSPFIATGVTLSHNQLFVSTQGRGVWTTSFPVNTEEYNKSNKELEIYPNPASDFIQVKNLKYPQLVHAVFIYDSSGRFIQQSKITSDQSINVNSLAPGIYFGKVISEKNDLSVFRFVVR